MPPPDDLYLDEESGLLLDSGGYAIGYVLPSWSGVPIMSQPDPYARQFAFNDFQSSNPSDPPPGASLDAEYNAIKETLTGILANMVLLQRDDGALANGIVGLDTISPGALTALSVAWVPRGPWVADGTDYEIGDVVTHDTGTFVCPTAHTSSGTFSVDLGNNLWMTLFDSSGAGIADGAITTAKLADGAVTLAKLTLTLLDLTGTIRGQGGISSGTATVGEQMANKQATGDVVTKAQRTTAAQGAVGYRVEGVNVTWDMKLATSATSLTWSNTLGSGSMSLSTDGLFDVSGAVRATSDVTPTTGVGPILRYVSGSGIGYLDCYNYATAAWKDQYIRGLTVVMVANGVTVATVSSTGLTIASGKALKLGSNDVGYMDLVPSSQSPGSQITLALADRGCLVPNSSGGWLIPANASVAFPIGTTIVLYNNSGSSQNCAITSDTLRLDGTATTGTRAVPQRGRATITKVASTEWVID